MLLPNRYVLVMLARQRNQILIHFHQIKLKCLLTGLFPYVLIEII